MVKHTAQAQHYDGTGLRRIGIGYSPRAWTFASPVQQSLDRNHSSDFLAVTSEGVTRDFITQPLIINAARDKKTFCAMPGSGKTAHKDSQALRPPQLRDDSITTDPARLCCGRGPQNRDSATRILYTAEGCSIEAGLLLELHLLCVDAQSAAKAKVNMPSTSRERGKIAEGSNVPTHPVERCITQTKIVHLQSIIRQSPVPNRCARPCQMSSTAASENEFGSNLIPVCDNASQNDTLVFHEPSVRRKVLSQMLNHGIEGPVMSEMTQAGSPLSGDLDKEPFAHDSAGCHGRKAGCLAPQVIP
ncbi:hypothetical protein QBC43DRAFT_334968 [Cladorrhinum sp. PSN259]|nr:hypothetical protein QBC43DRAFT_334968 [Cladorrhinum sp. PSN259]